MKLSVYTFSISQRAAFEQSHAHLIVALREVSAWFPYSRSFALSMTVPVLLTPWGVDTQGRLCRI